MDYRGNKYIEMQELAEKIVAIKKGICMDEMISEDVYLDDNAYTPSISRWTRLNGFRMNADKTSTAEHLDAAVNEWIRSSTGTGSDAAFVIQRYQGNTALYYGTNNRGIETAFQSNVSESNITTASPVMRKYRNNGIFTGTFSAQGLSDALLTSKTSDFYVACIFIPVADSEIHKIADSDKKYMNSLEEYKSYQRVYGNMSKRVENVTLPEVAKAINILEKEIEYIEDNIGKGFVRAVVRFGTNSEFDYRLIESVINSSFRFESGQGLDPVRCFLLESVNHNSNNILAIPYARINMKGFSGNIHALTLQSGSSIGAFCRPAFISCKGYYVKNYNLDEDSIDEFPVIEVPKNESLVLGKLVNGEEDAVIPYEKIGQHVFVTGSTGSGKTTTVKKMLCENYKKNIPFVVIEAAKKEYFSLMANIPELQIYTAGMDGKSLAFNPLQPEDGVLIENHVAAVVRALLASTGGEHPIPEAFNGLLKQTYKEFGWEYGQLAYTDEYKPFPTFKDVFHKVDKYIDEHAHYGLEVKQNLTAALSLRTETMYDGALGKLFAGSFGLQSKDLLETPCVIELSDFAEESVSFLMNILLFKFQCYLSHQPDSSKLKRIIVVEEAHNVFRKTMLEDSGRALSNNYFDKMLAEIRSSGTGLIISDQRPNLLSEAVLANTAVKIVHSLSDYDDRKVIGQAANLSDLQIKKTSEFEAGEGLISLRGIHGVQHLKVEGIKDTNSLNPACHICTNRFRCKKAAVVSMLKEMDPGLVKYHVTKIISNPYNPRILERNIAEMLKALNISATMSTKLCFLGEILRQYSDSTTQQRIIMQNFLNYMKTRC